MSLKKVMIMMMLLTSLNVVKADEYEDKRKEEQRDRAQQRCLEDIKCPHDGDFLSDLEKILPKKETDKIKLCRLNRALTCLAPVKEE